jgi:UDP-GlcNAc:undecaprenyl-phosphate/decaprenyl-phosphate GlcNAc-1-phosphate transferase
MSFADSVHALVHDGTAMWGFLTAAGLVLLLTPLVARLAPIVGGVDDKGDRPRVHGSRPIPRIGGVAIVIGIAVPMIVFIKPEGRYLGILLGALMVAALGFVDDIRGINASVKMVGIIVAALIPVVGFGMTWETVGLPLIGNFDLGWAAYPLTIFWIVALANLVNLIDGMDSLASGIVAIAAGSFAILAASFHRADAAALAAIICGATLAFLRYNFHPARVFMGDTGALALGFLLACVAVQGVLKTAATIALAGPLLVMAVPILDTSFVIAKRLKYKRSPFAPDQNHFYHRFMRIGFSQRRTAAYLHLWALLLAAYGIMLRFVPPRPAGIWSVHNSVIAAIVGVGVLAASVWMVYTLEILKARHFRAIGLGRFVREATDETRISPEEQVARDEEIEQAISGG